MQGLETLSIKSQLLYSSDFKIFENYKGSAYNLKYIDLSDCVNLDFKKL